MANTPSKTPNKVFTCAKQRRNGERFEVDAPWNDAEGNRHITTLSLGIVNGELDVQRIEVAVAADPVEADAGDAEPVGAASE